MKTAIILLTLVLTSYSANSQDTIRYDIPSKMTLSQKTGWSKSSGKFTITIVNTNSKFQFNTNPTQSFMNFEIAKMTEKYIVLKDNYENYGFYFVELKQLYTIDYFMSRYMVSGYGSESALVEQQINKIMELFKSGSTQKDVIQHLIKQTEYDF